MMWQKVLVFREPCDGLWNVVRATHALKNQDVTIPDGDWIAEGVGTWDRAMRIACDTVGIGWRR
jgi:hypothetical protein